MPRGIVYTALEKLMVYGIGFVQGVVLARLLCPEDFGLTAMLGVFLGMGGVLADSGLGTVLVAGVGGNGVNGRSPGFRAVERLVLRWNVGVAVLAYAVLAAAAPWIARWYGRPILAPLMWVMAAGLVISAASVVATARLLRREQFGRLAWANSLSTVVGAAVAILLAWRGFGVWSIVWMGLAYAAVRTAMVWVMGIGGREPGTRRDVGEGAAEGRQFAEMLRYGWKLTLSGAIHVIYLESYNLVIGKLWTPAAVGLFERGSRWAKLPGDIVNEAVGRVALPAMARELESPEPRMRVAWRLGIVNAVLLWPVLAALWIWAPEIVGGILGEQWLDCVPYMRILIVGHVFSIGGNIALQQLRANGRGGDLLKTDAWKKPIGIAALAASVPFGVAGLCWAWVIGEFAECMVDIIYALNCRTMPAVENHNAV